jgi:hypothetical protein
MRKNDLSITQLWWKQRKFLEAVEQATTFQGEIEHKFDANRMWRFDAAWPEAMVALEIDGGMWARAGSHKCNVCGQIPLGGHSSGAQRQKDREKMNSAAIDGWCVLHVTWDEVANGEALKLVISALRP